MDEILKIGNKAIGRRGLVCTLCKISIAGKRIYRIPATPESDFYGMSSHITVCAVCKEDK